MAGAANGNGGTISRGNMSVVISAAALVMLAFGGFITFQNSATDRRIMELRDDVQQSNRIHLRKDEHEEFKLRLDKDIVRIDHRREIDNAKIVSRTEHEARWVSYEKDIKLLSDRLNELRNATTSTYTVRDELNRLQTEIVELRRSLGSPRPPL